MDRSAWAGTSAPLRGVLAGVGSMCVLSMVVPCARIMRSDDESASDSTSSPDIMTSPPGLRRTTLQSTARRARLAGDPSPDGGGEKVPFDNPPLLSNTNFVADRVVRRVCCGLQESIMGP